MEIIHIRKEFEENKIYKEEIYQVSCHLCLKFNYYEKKNLL